MQNEEKWKNIPYYSGRYQASTLGRIRDVETGEILKSFSVNKKDTHQLVSLQSDGFDIQVGVHRLVASTFIPNMKFETVVHHIDNNPENNRVDNLMWVSQRQNTLFQDRFKGYSIVDGDKTLLTFQTQKELAKYIGVSIPLLRKYLKENADGSKSITYENCELLIIHSKELQKALISKINSEKMKGKKNSLGHKNSLGKQNAKGHKNAKGKGKIQVFINNLNEEELKNIKYDIKNLTVRKFKSKWNMTKRLVVSAVEELENKEVA